MAFPKFPFDGQILIDAYRVEWLYDAEAKCWKRRGETEDIPLASDEQSGLLSAKLKVKIDSIPQKGGGFAIITKPLKRDPGVPDGMIMGDVKLVSDSLDIFCVDNKGRITSEPCQTVIEGAEDELPGFDFRINNKFLEAFCIKVPSVPGSKGCKGEKGPEGEPGTGDGPVGEQGPSGKDETEPGTFTGVKILEDQGVYDTAVVKLDLEPDDGVLTVTKSKVKVPSDDTPADQVIADPIIRSVQFTDGWNYEIIRPQDDPLDKADPMIVHLPEKFTPPGISQIGTKKLSYIIDRMISKYQEKLDDAEKKYDLELSEFMCAKDKEARKVLAQLSQKLSECEWQLPIDYCLGITPETCDASIAIIPTERIGDDGKPIHDLVDATDDVAGEIDEASYEISTAIVNSSNTISETIAAAAAAIAGSIVSPSTSSGASGL